MNIFSIFFENIFKKIYYQLVVSEQLVRWAANACPARETKEPESNKFY